MAEPRDTPQPRRYQLRVPGLPPSSNARRRWGWPALYREGRAFRDATALLARQAHQGSPLARARVLATLVRTQPVPRDPDSAVASLKEVIDGLVVGGLLAGDSDEHIDLLVRQERTTRAVGPHVRLEIEELWDGNPRESLEGADAQHPE